MCELYRWKHHKIHTFLFEQCVATLFSCIDYFFQLDFDPKIVFVIFYSGIEFIAMDISSIVRCNREKRMEFQAFKSYELDALCCSFFVRCTCKFIPPSEYTKREADTSIFTLSLCIALPFNGKIRVQKVAVSLQNKWFKVIFVYGIFDGWKRRAKKTPCQIPTEMHE